MANTHPRFKCFWCQTWTRYNPNNMKLFNHKIKRDYGEKYHSIPNCFYGGKFVLFYLYERMIECRNLGIKNLYELKKEDIKKQLEKLSI